MSEFFFINNCLFFGRAGGGPRRLKRGFSVGADIDDYETQEILAKFKRKKNNNKVSMTDFQVIKPISKGAFGKVYLCRR